ncbi:MAG: hypothetical protein PUG16_06990 [Lachnospiraceae bacterium]|nr:hypothetical protein [Lachnospiraceae bacterium]
MDYENVSKEEEKIIETECRKHSHQLYYCLGRNGAKRLLVKFFDLEEDAEIWAEINGSKVEKNPLFKKLVKK